MLAYVERPAVPLFERAYSASGFWGHVQDTVGSLWERAEVILDTHESNQAFDLAVESGGSNDRSRFFTSWGSSLFNLVGDGPDWTMTSPLGPLPAADTVINAITPQSGALDVSAYTTGQYYLDFPASMPLVHVFMTGPALLSEKYNYTQVNGGWFCTAMSCDCPDGTAGSPPAWQPLGGLAYLGVAGDPISGTFGDITADPLSTSATRPRPARRRTPRLAPPPHAGRRLRVRCVRPAVARRSGSAESQWRFWWT